jgi:hypothetical protein
MVGSDSILLWGEWVFWREGNEGIHMNSARPIRLETCKFCGISGTLDYSYVSTVASMESQFGFNGRPHINTDGDSNRGGESQTQTPSVLWTKESRLSRLWLRCIRRSSDATMVS